MIGLWTSSTEPSSADSVSKAPWLFINYQNVVTSTSESPIQNQGTTASGNAYVETSDTRYEMLHNSAINVSDRGGNFKSKMFRPKVLDESLFSDSSQECVFDGVETIVQVDVARYLIKMQPMGGASYVTFLFPRNANEAHALWKVPQLTRIWVLQKLAGAPPPAPAAPYSVTSWTVDAATPYDDLRDAVYTGPNETLQFHTSLAYTLNGHMASCMMEREAGSTSLEMAMPVEEPHKWWNVKVPANMVSCVTERLSPYHTSRLKTALRANLQKLFSADLSQKDEQWTKHWNHL